MQNIQPVNTFSNMEARVGSGGQIMSDGAMSGQHQSSMHQLQPVVDSGWPSLMSIDPSGATFVPSFNAAAMMMMMMPQAGAPYPVMFAPNQTADKMGADGFSQSTAGLTNLNVSSMPSPHESKHSDAGVGYKQQTAAAVSQTEGNKQATATADYSDRPKKPLSPYMRFSKQMWSRAKASNPNMSICEIGAIIGRMWRELSDSDKKYYISEFEQEKTKYDEDIRVYLNENGLKPSDLIKPKAQKKQPTAPSSRSKKSSKLDSSSQNGPVSAGMPWPQNSSENTANQRNTASSMGSASSASSCINSHSTMTTMAPNSDNMLVFHMSDDGTSGYYIQQRGQTIAELKSDGIAPAASTSSANLHQMHVNSGIQNFAASQQQANVITEQAQVISQLKSALADAYQYIGQLQKELNMSRQMPDGTQLR